MTRSGTEQNIDRPTCPWAWPTATTTIVRSGAFKKRSQIDALLYDMKVGYGVRFFRPDGSFVEVRVIDTSTYTLGRYTSEGKAAGQAPTVYVRAAAIVYVAGSLSIAR